MAPAGHGYPGRPSPRWMPVHLPPVNGYGLGRRFIEGIRAGQVGLSDWTDRQRLPTQDLAGREPFTSSYIAAFTRLGPATGPYLAPERQAAAEYPLTVGVLPRMYL
jgi:hypothetical protein